MQNHAAQTDALSCLVLSHFLSLTRSLLLCVKSAVSARSSVHSQGVLRAGSFLKAPLMDWPDIPSKWSTLSVNSLSDKDPPLFTFPFYKSSPRYEVHKEGQMSTKSSLCVRPGGKGLGWKRINWIPIHVLVVWNEESALWRIAAGCLSTPSLPPQTGPVSGGEIGAFLSALWRQLGLSADLAIGRYSCQSCHYLWTREHVCAHTVCADPDRHPGACSDPDSTQAHTDMQTASKLWKYAI